ncbi:helix-turn-helix domain-containing protein [Clostridium kluyveri]|uniref:HTH cro/C1-type domain-containing protein n=1 Tax=Clostridium kluyveri TaxID=1534 RepID=A0A1L5FBR2_CLOKL|nr:helix-turn-helix domain-containing protein [Clostridium kluyveri]APM40461.1 hypothetical protein BS101_17840 [Clostridium kluyveri]
MPRKKTYEQGSFGELLSLMIEHAGLTKTAFQEQIGITKTYLFDVLNGRVSPPAPDMQFKMIKLLKPRQKDKINFFELAAKKRSEVPADIAMYLRNGKHREEIRKKIDYTHLFIDGGNESD